MFYKLKNDQSDPSKLKETQTSTDWLQSQKVRFTLHSCQVNIFTIFFQYYHYFIIMLLLSISVFITLVFCIPKSFSSF